MRRLTLILAISLTFGVCIAWQFSKEERVSVTALRKAMIRNDRQQLIDLTAQVRRSRPHAPPVLLLASDAAAQLNDFNQALAFLDEVRSADPSFAIEAQSKAAEINLKIGRLNDSQRDLATLSSTSQNVEFIRRLAAVLDLQGRRRESADVRKRLLPLRQFSAEDLILIGNVDEPFQHEEFLDQWRQSEKTDETWRLVDALVLMKSGRPASAIEILQGLTVRHPDFLEAKAKLGMALLDTGQTSQLIDWAQDIRDEAQRHPDVLFVRGELAAMAGDSSGATRCFLDALHAAPNHQPAANGLAELLKKTGNLPAASQLQEHSRTVRKLNERLKEMYFKGPAPERMSGVANLAEQAGRLTEALAWTELALTVSPGETGLIEARDRIAAATLANPVEGIPVLSELASLAAIDLPPWPQKSGFNLPFEAARDSVPINFEDRTTEAGLNFTYHSGQQTQQARIFLTMGGGIASVDYDGDDWPDLYFTQGTDWPPEEHIGENFDQLFRNFQGVARNVTNAAGIADDAYSQGTAAGDIDGDGFPDLYVANIGRNRLLHNNGDGTFSDMSDTAGLTGDQWTSSCVIVDVNADGFADLFDVNYIARGAAFEVQCGEIRPETCLPTMFSGEPDRLHLNSATGEFTDITVESSLGDRMARGLGVVAGPLGDFGDAQASPGEISLFVANDMEANALWRRTDGSTGTDVHFEDVGIISGVATDRDGQAQASMGIAADDFDRDGRVDLFVTHFYNESNTLYQQLEGGFYSDQSRRFHLRTPSLLTLGFGTQAIDADLNGFPDIVVTNGHIDDFSERQIPFRMSPQFFRNINGERFTDESTSAGRFFRKKGLGRSLVRFDWNCDGLEDFAVSHLDSPAVLVLNESASERSNGKSEQGKSIGNHIVLKLVATKTHRDAVGSRVQVKAGDLVRSRVLLTGDGFQCSNEKILVFGLGVEKHVEQITVTWPSGSAELFSDVRINQSLTLVEGRNSLYPRPTPARQSK